MESSQYPLPIHSRRVRSCERDIRRRWKYGDGAFRARGNSVGERRGPHHWRDQCRQRGPKFSRVGGTVPVTPDFEAHGNSNFAFSRLLTFSFIDFYGDQTSKKVMLTRWRLLPVRQLPRCRLQRPSCHLLQR
jgi:hypothetical protein